MDQRQHVEAFITKNEEYQQIALDVCDSINAVKDRIWQKAADELKSFFANEDGIRLECAKGIQEMCSGKWKSFICVIHDEWTLIYEFGANTSMRNVCVVLKGGDQEGNMSNPFLGEVKKISRFAHTNIDDNNIHYWWGEYAGSWLETTNPWRDMCEHKQDSQYSSFVQKVIGE